MTVDRWCSQTRGELAPYGGPLEMGAKWIRQHRRLYLSSLRRNFQLKVYKKVSYLNKNSLRVFEFRDSYVLWLWTFDALFALSVNCEYGTQILVLDYYHSNRCIKSLYYYILHTIYGKFHAQQRCDTSS